MGTESHGSRLKLFLIRFPSLFWHFRKALILKDSRAAERDIVKVTEGNARLLFLAEVERCNHFSNA